jgi:hypothetical protein
MESIMQILLMALLVEAIWETLKMVWQDGKISKDRIGALIVGQLIAWAIGLDLFRTLQLEPRIAWIGVIALGILISRGSNFIHDLTNKLAALKAPLTYINALVEPEKTEEVEDAKNIS